jgi:flagellar secretion chaperone FliS
MYNSNYATAQNNRLNQYLVSEIVDASPQQIILKIYDFAILNCARNDLLKTNNAIQELVNALRFDDEKVKEISIGLFRLYRFCQEEMRKGNNETVRVILTDLRDTWINALKNYKG